MKLRMAAPCLFGLEKPVADELKDMGAGAVAPENGCVYFEGDEALLARANIRSRFAERIRVVVGAFPATTFTELFDGVRALPWEDYIPREGAFPVKGWSLNAALHSVPDCQAIVKKAIAARLGGACGMERLPETGAPYPVTVSLLKDRATLTIDTSGEGLHKRGYRRNANDAPLKETLAAAMVKLSRIYEDSVVYDPFCGSGTILIEAALLARNIAPGLRRAFGAEKFDFVPESVWRQERGSAMNAIRRDVPFRAVGSDSDPACVALTLANAKKAGVVDCVSASEADVAGFAPDTPRGVIITNPPYGDRMLDLEQAERLYGIMGRVFPKGYGWRTTVITSHEQFEVCFGRPADKRRKLYNGNRPCQVYFYFKGQGER